MLVALNETGDRTVAESITDRELKFFCPGCGKPVILKRGKIKIPHFAHSVLGLCDWDAGETTYHIEAKDWLFHYFKKAGPEYDVSLEYTGINGVRPDVFVGFENSCVAFEVQHSGISEAEINRRNSVYMDNGIAVMWLLTSDVGKKMESSEFRLREQDVYLYHQYFNNLFVFNGSGIDVVNVDNVRRLVDEAYNRDGELVGGYTKTLKRTFEVSKRRAIDLIDDCSLFRKPRFKERFKQAYLFGLTKFGGTKLKNGD